MKNFLLFVSLLRLFILTNPIFSRDTMLIYKLYNIKEAEVVYKEVNFENADKIPLSIVLMQGNQANTGPLPEVTKGFAKYPETYWNLSHGNIAFIQTDSQFLSILPKHFFSDGYLDSVGIWTPQDGADIVPGRINFSQKGQYYINVRIADSIFHVESATIYSLDYDPRDSLITYYSISGEVIYFPEAEMRSIYALSKGNEVFPRAFPRGAFIMKIPKLRSDPPGQSGGIAIAKNLGIDTLVGINDCFLEFEFLFLENPNNPINFTYLALTFVSKGDFWHLLKK